MLMSLGSGDPLAAKSGEHWHQDSSCPTWFKNELLGAGCSEVSEMAALQKVLRESGRILPVVGDEGAHLLTQPASQEGLLHTGSLESGLHREAALGLLPLLLSHTGTSYKTRRYLECIKHDYTAFEKKVLSTGSRWCLLDPTSEGEGL